MQNIRLVLSVFFIASNLCIVTKAYDSCKDILRDGVKDHVYNQSHLDKQLVLHNQFCSMAKQHNLDEDNFQVFAKDYAKTIRSDTNSYGGGAGVGIGPFSFNGNYGQTNNSSDLSENDKENLLNSNKQKIIDYYSQNCGKKSYEESLKTEAVLLSKIANENIIKAWRDCMISSTGFFADIIPTSVNNENGEIEYDVMISWKSNENTNIDSIVLRFKQDLVTSPYKTIQEDDGFSKTINICESENCILHSGSTFPLTIVHKNSSKSTNLRIIAKTNTGATKSHVLILPKMFAPTPIIIDNSHFSSEYYCDNNNCSKHMSIIRSNRYRICEKFIVDTYQLNSGTCEKCGHLLNLRFCFRNCRYKFKGQMAYGDVIEKLEEIANENLRYLYPFSDGRYFYSRIKIITGTINGPSLESDHT